MSAARALPELSRLVMRRAARVGLVAVLLALLVGLLRIDEAIEEEVDAAMQLAEMSARLARLEPLDDAGVLSALRAQQQGGLRHLTLTIRDESGRALLAPDPPAVPEGLLDLLADLHRRWSEDEPVRSVSWTLPRPDGRLWMLTLQASPEGERREALADIGGVFLVLLGCIAGLLLVMRRNVRRSLAPLNDLLAAIDGIEHGRLAPVRALTAMPTRELDQIAAALRQLAGALDEAESRRRLLSQKMQTLQEDERARLARELHDEFGQHLTALRFDAAWLARQLADQPRLLEVVQGISRHCGEVQRDIRDLLVQLRPLGPVMDGHEERVAPQRLQELLEALVRGWQVLHDGREGRPARDFRLALHIDASAPALPRELALAVYRLSQEALTNAARHAQATRVALTVDIDAQAVCWSVEDDGLGLGDPAAAMQRGNGLGGMQERVWALGGQWRLASDGSPPGLRLQARLPLSRADVDPPS